MGLRRIITKITAFICLAAIAAPLAMGCGQAAPPQGAEGAVVREALEYIPREINPYDRGDGPEGVIASLVFGALTEASDGSDGVRRYSGGYAEDLPSIGKDGLTWTYKLRQGQSFSDGSPADAYAFLASLKALLDPDAQNPEAAVFWGAVKVAGAGEYAMGEEDWEAVGIQIHDRYTLRFTLEAPVPATVGLEALNAVLAAVPGNGAAVRTEELLKLPASGPYKVAEYIPGQLLALEKNIYYPNAYKYAIQRIEFRAGDEAALFEAGLTDRLRVTPDLRYSYDLADAVSDNGGVPWFIYINAESGPLADIDLRKALLYGLDREKVTAGAFGVYTPVTSYVSLGAWVGDPYGNGLTPYHDDRTVKAAHGAYGYNPGLALEYFDKAFARNNGGKIEVTLYCFNESDCWGSLAVMVRDFWMSLFGADRFHLFIEVMTAEEVYAACENGDYELAFGAMSQNNLNPWATMAVWSSGYPGKPDTFKSGAYDALQFDAAFGELAFDSAAKTAALLELEELLFDFVPAIPVFQNTNMFVAGK